MMTKQEHVEYWKNMAARDWTTARHLLKSKDYVPALFFAHLVLEKLCKAHWVKDNKNNYPPKIHNLVRLAEHTNLKLSEEEMDFLRKMNQFQLEVRYPDYRQSLYRKYKKTQTTEIFNEAKRIRTCLLKELRHKE